MSRQLNAFGGQPTHWTKYYLFRAVVFVNVLFDKAHILAPMIENKQDKS